MQPTPLLKTGMHYVHLNTLAIYMSDILWLCSFAVVRATPPSDASQDVTDLVATASNGMTTMQFTRLRDSGDSSDISLSNCRYLLFAWGGSVVLDSQFSAFGYHGINNRYISPERVCFPSARTCPGAAN